MIDFEEPGDLGVFIDDDQPLHYEEVEAWFGERIIRQPAACKSAAYTVTTFKAAMNDPARPVSVLFFCGPTGVGKTALALALARYFYGANGHEEGLIRLDMSEYGTPGAVNRLLGESHQEPSTFISRIRQKPFSVVLFDEIEKASPEVFDLLLNVMDEGRLVDRFGRLTSFKSAILIMTSNVGAGQGPAIGFDDSAGPTPFDAVRAYFRPEFFNRLDHVISFNALTRPIIEAITQKELKDIEHREGLARRQLSIQWSDALVQLVANKGYDPKWGARHLQRIIEDVAINPLAHFLLAHPTCSNTTLRADLDPDQKPVFTQN